MALAYRRVAQQSLVAMALAGLSVLLSVGHAAARNATVEGRVLEFTTEAPVADVHAELLDSRQRRVAAATTNDAGAFRFNNVRPGTYQIRTRSIGYREVITPEFTVADEPVSVIVRIAVDAVPLAPLEVVSRPARLHPNLAVSDFMVRAERNMGGAFIMRDEIEERQPQRVTDLLQTVGSITVVNHARGGVVHNSRTQCQPSVFIDNRLVFAVPVIGNPRNRFPSAFEAINSVHWSEVEGVEVYRGSATVPAQFSGSRAGCGVIAVWTRR